jgi:hypothetical protein
LRRRPEKALLPESFARVAKQVEQIGVFLIEAMRHARSKNFSPLATSRITNMVVDTRTFRGAELSNEMQSDLSRARIERPALKERIVW